MVRRVSLAHASSRLSLFLIDCRSAANVNSGPVHVRARRCPDPVGAKGNDCSFLKIQFHPHLTSPPPKSADALCFSTPEKSPNNPTPPSPPALAPLSFYP